jgi:hypothetical protein
MTTKELLKMYSITMSNVVIDNKSINGKYFIKNFVGGKEMEAYFQLLNPIAEDLTNNTIPLIQNLIEGHEPDDPELAELGSTTSIFAVAQLDGVNFINRHSGETVQIVPLEHFKMIAEAWRDFLLQTPLSGTMV